MTKEQQVIDRLRAMDPVDRFVMFGLMFGLIFGVLSALFIID